MKKFLFSILCIIFSAMLYGQTRLVYIPTESFEEVQNLFEQKDLTIHHYKDNFVIATLNGDLIIKNMIVVDQKAFEDNDFYTLVYCANDKKSSYTESMLPYGKLLYDAGNFLIMKQLRGKELLEPAKNDGTVIISNKPALLPVRQFDFPTVSEINPDIQALIDQISIDSIMTYIQHMEDYGTRRYNSPQADQAASWIKDKYVSWGLEANVEDFSTYSWFEGYINSSNVIAIQPGVCKPDEYIICGGHFDSVNWYDGNEAPGADDNATGTAGVMEIARILSQYEFERSIIYCAFGAEEIGLCGSAVYAEKCQSEGMNILGYFNIDMSGYIKPGFKTLISIIHPSSATPLANYYINVLNTYFAGTQYEQLAGMSGGDSDHTSFNQNGFMGIYPFETDGAHNPYIHTSQDYIGKGINSEEQVLLYTNIVGACIGELGLLQTSLVVKPQADFIVEGETEIFEGNTVSFIDNSNNEPVSWKWYFEGGEPETSEEQNATVTYSVEGTYEVKLIVENCAGIDSVIKENYIVVLPEVGIKNHDIIKIAPNPVKSNSYVKVDCGQIIKSVELVNLSGLTLKTYSINSSSAELFIPAVSSGMYFLNVTTELGKEVIKIQVQ